MDFRDSPAEAEFRAHVREWLRAHLPKGWPEGRAAALTLDEAVEVRRWWQRELYDGGWLGLTWPKQYGGQGGTLLQQVIFDQEAVRAQAPDPANVIGLYMAGPTIMAWGTDEQKTRYLQPLLRGDEIWCQGFSEPGSGSDLGSVRTRAVREGDTYIVNGQKVWTSYGHLADFCILVTRTDAGAEKHAGLTYLIAGMREPGVTVRPLVQITGDPEFSELFFDDARVPVENRLGGEGDGWKVAMTTLMHERGTMGAALQAGARITLDRLVELVHGLDCADDPAVRERLAGFQLDVEALRITNLRSLSKLRKGTPGPEGSMAKLLWERVQQGMGEFAMELLGTAGLVMEGPETTGEGFWQHIYLRGRGHTIEAGTTEILKNIIAERVLGLPKGR
ncbi:MAG: acyl-CoA dehydrogenase family protein [Egibacteraceae bacterium]